MIASTAFLTALIGAAQSPITTVWVVTQSQAALDTTLLDDQEIDSEHLRQKLGLNAIVIDTPDVRLIVSDYAVPLNSTKLTNKFLSDIQGNTEFNYSLESAAGKQLLSFILSKHFLDKVYASDGSKPLGLTAGVMITDPSRPGLVNIQQPQAHKQDDFAFAESPKLDQNGLTDRAAQQRNKENLFPRNRFVEPLSLFATNNGKKVNADASTLSIALLLLEKVANELIQEEIKSKNLITNILNEIATKDFPELDGMVGKPTNFEDLPKSIKESLERSILSSWESSGFTSENEALIYLQSNPKLKIEINLIAFLKHRSANDPPGINRGSAFIIKP
jgi:hypothetical protein